MSYQIDILFSGRAVSSNEISRILVKKKKIAEKVFSQINRLLLLLAKGD
jgi:hypothetical protein